MNPLPSTKDCLMQELFETKEYISIEDLIIHLIHLAHHLFLHGILDACKLRMITLVQTEPYGPILIVAVTRLSL